MMARLQVLISLLSAIACIRAASVVFQTISKGHSSAIEDALNEVYRTEEEFQKFWTSHDPLLSTPAPSPAPTPEIPDRLLFNVPDVDFTSQMVIAVFMGQQGSGGNIEITSVEEDENGDMLTVNYSMGNPCRQPGAMCATVVTQPHHIISLDASDKSVSFVGKTLAYESSAYTGKSSAFRITHSYVRAAFSIGPIALGIILHL